MFMFFQPKMALLRIYPKEIIIIWAPWGQELYSGIWTILKYLLKEMK